MYAPEVAGQIVNACAVLHNMHLHYRLPIDEENVIPENEPIPILNNLEVTEMEVHRGPRAVAQRIQKQIMLEWFRNYHCAWERDN